MQESKYFCLCCEKKIDHFKILDDGIIRCPFCDSFPRHRALMHYFKYNNFFSKKTRILDIAPTWIIQKKLKRHPKIEHISLDLDFPIADIQADITSIPFKSNVFDLILCLHVLEHVPDDFLAISEMFRVLRSGGVAIIIVPLSLKNLTIENPSITDPEERKKLFGQHNHVRRCGKDYIDRIRKGGFIVKQEVLSKGLNDDEVEKYGTLRELAFICSKKD